MTNHVSRLAPSPTGALHLGNARTFIVNWALARNRDWWLLMRIEDLDGPRVKPGAIEQTLDILAWLGLDFDGEILRQSDDLAPYREAMRALDARGVIYACTLSRTEIEQAASAPHAGDHEQRFPPDLRPENPAAWTFASESDTNYRLKVDDEVVEIDDQFAGPSVHRPGGEVGDFALWTKRGEPSYQLAVTVDDARQGVTDVVRGDDLLPSAARQTLIYRALDLTPPRFWHLPLVQGEDGRRLAKRHGDTRLATYRERGVPAERVIGLLAFWCGLSADRQPCGINDFLTSFDLDRLSHAPVTFTETDHAWLLGDR